MIAFALASLLALAACGGGTSGGETTLSLVGYAVPKAANNAAERAWAETPDGRGVRWRESYGASGDQSRAVVNGLKADYVHFSLEGDVTRLVRAGLVDPGWNTGPTKGIVSDSVVVLVVRKGNPKGIKGWNDLVRPGVKIVTPNPGSSGSAKWNVLAAYGQSISGGATKDGAINDRATKDKARDYLTKFFRNVAALPGSGRDATTAFTSGTGDVLLSYENEAILARQHGVDLDYIVPDTTLEIENPGAVLKDANPKATKWRDFVLSRQGQMEFVKKGFRPVIEGVKANVPGANNPADPFPIPRRLLTVGDFGGWDKVDKELFDSDTGLVTEIQRNTGKS